MSSDQEQIEATMNELLRVMFENKCPPYLIDSFLMNCPEEPTFNVVMKLARENDAFLTEIGKLRQHLVRFEETEIELKAELETARKTAKHGEKLGRDVVKLQQDLTGSMNERDRLVERNRCLELRLDLLEENNHKLTDENKKLGEEISNLQQQQQQQQSKASTSSTSSFKQEPATSSSFRTMSSSVLHHQQAVFALQPPPSPSSSSSPASVHHQQQQQQQQAAPGPFFYPSPATAHPQSTLSPSPFFNFTFAQPPFAISDRPILHFASFPPPFFQH